MTNLEWMNSMDAVNMSAEDTAVEMMLRQFANDYEIEELCELDLDRYLREYHERKKWLELEVANENTDRDSKRI